MDKQSQVRALREEITLDEDRKYHVIDGLESLNFIPTQKFSISFWMKSSLHQSGAMIAKMSNEVEDNFTGWDISLHNDGRKSQIMFNLIEKYPQNCLVVTTSTWKNLCDNRWHHIFIMHDYISGKSEVKILVDGICKSTKTLISTSVSKTENNLPVTIGARNKGAFNFIGTIYDVQIFMTKLTDDEILKMIRENERYTKEVPVISSDKERKPMIQLENVHHSFKLYHEKNSDVFSKLRAILVGKNRYEKLIILNDVSFELAKGEVLGIVGRNGSGKTSLLKIIAKIIKPTCGKVEINGKISSFLSLGAGLNYDLTVKENTILYGMILGETKENMKKRLQDVISFAELEKFSDVKIKDFSTGMLMKLAFAIAICVDPDILLVDEITSVGDYSFQQKSLDAFIKIKNSGKSIILVSHNLEQLDTFCDKIILLENGHITTAVDKGDVIDRYIELMEKT